MTRKADLIALRDAVQAGKAPVAVASKADRNFKDNATLSAFTTGYTVGSVDAALAFLAAVLPDAWCSVRRCGKYGHATVDVDGEEYDANNCETPACALLLATLNALIAETDT